MFSSFFDATVIWSSHPTPFLPKTSLIASEAKLSDLDDANDRTEKLQALGDHLFVSI